MPRPLDLDRWKRRQHFEFFRRYENPFFNLCAEVDVTALAAASAVLGGPSFFIASLHHSLLAANGTEEFRYRLAGDGVVVHEVIHGGSTVLRPDETFVFAYFDFDPDPGRFHAHAAGVLEEARSGSGALAPRPERDDLIHYSVIPWVSFSSFAHARSRAAGDSVPKIVFGRHREVCGRRLMRSRCTTPSSTASTWGGSSSGSSASSTGPSFPPPARSAGRRDRPTGS
jgi:chloramphenicol O-acetyltransferase type A